MTRSGWIWGLAGVLSTGVVGCKEDPAGSTDETGDPTDSNGDDGSPDAGDVTGADGNDDNGCVPGVLGCVCAEGVCSGVLACVQDECVQAPEVEFDDDYPDVLAGLRIPVDVNADGETITWSQTAGPTVELLNNSGTNIEVDVPADLADGDTFTLTVEVSLNGVTVSDSLDITIREAVFANVFPEVTDPEQLGATDGLAFNGTSMWVVSSAGFVSEMAPGDEGADPPVPASFVQRYDVGGLPMGANFVENEILLIANSMLSEVQTLNILNGDVGTYFDQLDGGSPLGAADFPLVSRNDGDVLLSNHVDGQILYYDTGNPDNDPPVPPSGVLLAEGLGVNPNALAFGPEGRGMVFVGVQDAVIRVPYDDGMIGQTSTYLDLAGQCGEVDGLIFDEGGNMWVGCPETNSLFVARYVGGIDTGTTVSRSWSDVGTGISRFANLSFGGGDFSDRAVYWTNLEDGTVGVLGVGLRGLDD